MMISSGIVLGLISSLTFGILDILITSASRSSGVIQSLVIAQSISAGILLLYLMNVFVAGISVQLFLTFLLVGVSLGTVNTLANISLYKALELGPIALVSPISAAYGLITTLLAISLTRQPLFPSQYIAIMLISLSILLSIVESANHYSVSLAGTKVQFIRPIHIYQRLQYKRRYKGLFFALVSMICFGVEFFGISIATTYIGPLQPILWSRLCSVFILVFIIFTSKKHYYAQKGINLKQLSIIALIGVLDTFGMIWYDIGTSQSATSIVAALSSTYTLLPTVVGIVFYRERLTSLQWVWTGMLIGGIMILSLGAH